MTLRHVLVALLVTTLADCNGSADNASLDGKHQLAPSQKTQSVSAYTTVVQRQGGSGFRPILQIDAK